MVLTVEERRERHRLAVQRHRDRETPDARSERLQRERERRRRRGHANTNSSAGEVLRPTEGPHKSWLEGDIPRLHPVSTSMKEEVLHRLRLALGPPGLDSATCAVCDCIKLCKSMHMISIGDDRIFLQQMQLLLSSADEHLPGPITAEYDCSDMFSCLDGMLLSRRGVHPDGFVQVCRECYASLEKQLIPKFAIKNGFYVGSLPTHVAHATLPERLMTQTVSVVAVTRVMRGGAHRAIRSHCLAFDSTPGPPATLLPTAVRNINSYRVVLAGPFTTEQQACVRKMHLVRREVVKDLLAFYCNHNVLYENIVIDCSQLAAEAVAEHLINEEIDAAVAVDNMDAESDRVGSAVELGGPDAETNVIEHRVVFISEDREISTHSAAPAVPTRVAEMPGRSASQPQFLVRHSSKFAGDDGLLFARMFPHLFPYGRGHPNEQRRIPVSAEACIRHYCQLSSRRFAEDELFTLVSFDHLTLKRMYTQVAVKCQRDPSRFERYSSISEASLMEALRKKELVRQGRTTASHNDASSASDFLRTVELSGGAIWGSDSERAQCRRRAFAYQARFGQPALFVTLTPNVSSSFVMAHYTGITSVSSLFDANVTELPTRSALHSACLRNDVASARLFMHNMDAFIEHVLGVPLLQMKSKPFDGLFGDVSAYFGMVETQGGGTLHSHFLVWLADAPPNTDAFRRAVNKHGDQYYLDIAAYTDSVVGTSLPLDVAVETCRFCGHSFADLQALPIPPEAYEDPSRDRIHTRGEPLLVQCAGCGTKMSSQHVLRRVLLRHRPATWPPPMRPYSSQELDAAVQMEAGSRGSVRAAKAAVFRRDMHLATNGSDGDDSYGSYLRTLNAAPTRHELREDDAFRNDSVAQAVMTLPPSVDDCRWSPQDAAFAVSLLVFMLNLHWWSHVGSCFKSSRAAAKGQCRYRFPRARSISTSCTSAGVELARHPPFEYINGYNAIIMQTFKSNHDVQVLLGGLEALLRIYYATKYVTKMQSLVDSVTAVALASFKRRELREQQNSASLQVDRSVVGRRRVSSMVFALSNRREIAGPMAALYLLRGSCAYMSAPCAALPLFDVLRELTQRDTHSCSLVELREGDTNVTFRAASFLDDYRYRPLSLGT